MSELNTNFVVKRLCLWCGNQILNIKLQKFCSKDCKNESQKKRIRVKCDGCFKFFSKMPCHQRKSNYCSLVCYWSTTNRKELRNCKVCNKEFLAERHSIMKGFGIFCSRECQHKTYPPRVIKFCKLCNKRFEIWPSKIELVKYCSKKCADDSMRDYVSRVCEGCKMVFNIPRSDLNRGRGHFCTYVCFKHHKGETSIERKVRLVLQKNDLSFKQEVKFGKRFFVDFLLKEENLVIECDGTYWHSMKKAKDRDRRKNTLLKSLGYKVLRLSEDKINQFTRPELSNFILSNI